MRALVFMFLFSVSAFGEGQAPVSAPVQKSTDAPPPARSVYEINPAVDGAIIGITGFAAALAYFKADAWIKPRCPCSGSEVNSFDRGAIGNSNSFLDSLSDATLVAAVIAPPVLDALDLGFSKEFTEDLVVYTETFSMNSFLTSLAKVTVQRPLPRTYANDPKLINQPGGYRSFYSGHTSTTFSALSMAAVTLNSRYHAGVLPWLVVAGVGASVGVERVAAGRHFPTDVLVGVVAGTAVGVLVPYFHRKNPSSGFFVTAAPVDDGGVLYAKLSF